MPGGQRRELVLLVLPPRPEPTVPLVLGHLLPQAPPQALMPPCSLRHATEEVLAMAREWLHSIGRARCAVQIVPPLGDEAWGCSRHWAALAVLHCSAFTEAWMVWFGRDCREPPSMGRDTFLQTGGFLWSPNTGAVLPFGEEPCKGQAVPAAPLLLLPEAQQALSATCGEDRAPHQELH